MKIAFYGQPLLNANKTGVGYYEDGVVRGLLKEYPEQDYMLDIFGSDEKESQRMQTQYGEKLEISRFRGFSERIFKVLTLVLPIPYHWLFPKEREITHFCNFIIPAGVRGKKVVTIHDLAFRAYPETVRGRTMLMLKRNLKKSIQRADKIVTESEFTKKELQKYYDVPSEKIVVTGNGVDMDRFHTGYEKERMEAVKQKYHIEGSYFLYLGTLEPRKNLVGLIQAYKKFYDRMKKEKKETPYLVLAGGKGWMYDEIFRTVQKLSLEQQVHFTGYVDEEDKPCLMSGASVFCFPSFYEGFGMPPVEAMACGTPVLTSNDSSLAEVTGDAACQINPHDIDEMADAMQRMWTEPEFCKELVEKGLQRVKQYSWENTAKILHEVYETIV